MKSRLLTGFVLVGVALAGTGCGGSSKSGGSGTGTTSSASSKAAFISQLNSLCKKANTAFSATHNVQGEVAVVSHYVSLFGALKPPSELSSLYTRYLAVLRRELAALKHGNQNELFKLAHSQAKPLVKQIGAFGCVTGS